MKRGKIFAISLVLLLVLSMSFTNVFAVSGPYISSYSSTSTTITITWVSDGSTYYIPSVEGPNGYSTFMGNTGSSYYTYTFTILKPATSYTCKVTNSSGGVSSVQVSTQN